jgi:hypothetical protein
MFINSLGRLRVKTKSETRDLLEAVVRVQVDRLRLLVDLSTRFVVDRVKQDPTSHIGGFDEGTGDLLGALSDAALAAKAAIERLIISKGGEPGHGP